MKSEQIVIPMILAMGLGLFIGCSSDQTENQWEQQMEQQELQRQQGNQEIQRQQSPQQQQQQLQDQQSQSSPVSVSEEELRRFAKGMEEIRSVDSETQQEMRAALAESGIDPQRYQEITRAQQTPDDSADLTAQEREQFRKAQEKVQQTQREAMQEQQEAIRNSGLDLQRFREISDAIRQNPDLMKRYQQHIEEKK